MWLDLREIIEVPGASMTFEAELDPEALLQPGIEGFASPPHAAGRVENTAGLLQLRAEITAEMQCVCVRCGSPFERSRVQEVSVPLTAESEEDDGEAFPLEGDGIDVSQTLETCFILETESQVLCREDCRGRCPMCGKNWNDGDCGCTKPKDPRFAVLEQLLDNTEN